MDTYALAALFALVIDHVWGEPRAKFHPVVWIGKYLNWSASRFAPKSCAFTETPLNHRKIFWQGALYWSTGALIVLLSTIVITIALQELPYGVEVLLLGCLLKPLFAWRMLREEVVAVGTALTRSLGAGRVQLSRLVSRDVENLDASQICEAAIETLAENLNDSVVAPLFWFAIFGLPGAAVYRFANTADAMWGYPSVRGGHDWQWAGKWAARADDILSWIPARITAMLLLIGSPAKLKFLAKEAARTPSPNSGWPMAAIALYLDVRLSKPGVYSLNERGREVVLQDLITALNLTRVTVIVLFFILYFCGVVGLTYLAGYQ